MDDTMFASEFNAQNDVLKIFDSDCFFDLDEDEIHELEAMAEVDFYTVPSEASYLN
ncbi:hypothetical protein GK047_12420 [Paenibacillus sp. SYP-B3998]|uniref:Uncharacterized protein n=1 Tax=Paenibacillus sp. SYP-B3998 TaxID=2678564 RepID=A0A6G3ZX69_9BACL|nr:hypothetical protein [Paenibacillus sp. SYP-B3998]NEW06816.1 hypothetical protein [Paenibacillus sp. SYP-B3998]